MIKKYTYGTPFPTESVTEQFAASEGMPEFGTIHLQEGFSFTYRLRDEDIVYGLGEANRGINKRGYQYISNNSDNAQHHADARGLARTVRAEQRVDAGLIHPEGQVVDDHLVPVAFCQILYNQAHASSSSSVQNSSSNVVPSARQMARHRRMVGL